MNIKRVVALVAVMSLIGCGAPTPSVPPSVTYEVTFSAKYVDIHYKNSTGGTTSVSAVENKVYKQGTGAAQETWTQEISLPEDGFAYISAQISYSEGGEVTVSIKRAGYQTKTSTSSGQYAIADASARYR